MTYFMTYIINIMTGNIINDKMKNVWIRKGKFMQQDCDIYNEA